MSAKKEKSVCDYNEFRRPRYFHGMLLDDKDFLAEQGYHAGKRRLLNRMLHGSGVVCGLDLNGKKGAQWIEVTSGLALDCCGNEIWVNKSRRFDLAQLLPAEKLPPDKAICKEPEEGDELKQYYIGIRYDEKGTDPVSVYLPGAGCEERTCENSRVKEGYCIEIAECPPKKELSGLLKKFCDCETGYERKEKEEAELLCGNCEGLEGKERCKCLRLEEFCEQSVPCPQCGCCDKPCHVILGRIEVDKNGCLQTICINECREYVLTGRMVKHLIVSALAGAEQYVKVDVGGAEITLPDARELANNPIKALCWVLRYFVVQEGEARIDECAGLTPKTTAVTRKEHEEVRSKIQDQQDEQQKTATAVKQLQTQTDKRIKELEKIIKEMQK